MNDALPETTAAAIRAALVAGNKIEAIRLYRDFSGVGLAEAKAFIEQIARGDHLANSPTPPEPDAIRTALFAGNKIEAVKLHRVATGVGLREAKLAMDALEDELRTSAPERFAQPKAKGCFAVLVLIAGLAGTTWVALR